MLGVYIWNVCVSLSVVAVLDRLLKHAGQVATVRAIAREAARERRHAGREEREAVRRAAKVETRARDSTWQILAASPKDVLRHEWLGY